mgnify:CR=1 FL=1
MLKPSSRILLRNWWPVVLWLGVLRTESTEMASAQNTSSLLYQALSYMHPSLDAQLVDTLDEVLRKTGHFFGYAFLGVLVFLALRATNRDRLKPVLRREWGSRFHDLWRRQWAALSVMVTLITAACDEIHQRFLPNRTGRWQDVILDCCGALILQALLYWLARREAHRRVLQQSKGHEPQFSSAG